MKKIDFGKETILKGQCCIEIPVLFGVNRISVLVRKGKIRVNHGQYTPDGGTWLDSPSGRIRGYDFIEGDEATIEFDIREA